MAHRPGRRGPDLPYRPLAGVVPCAGGWLVASGKLQGVTLSPQDPEILPTLIDVLDYRPSYEIIALHAPIGLLAENRPGGRTCDREARRLLGWRRGAAIQSAPSRAALKATDLGAGVGEGVSAATRLLLPKIREVVADVQSYWQRTVFEVHPELSYYQLNDDQPLKFSKQRPSGRAERRAVLEAKFPAVDRLLDNRPRGMREPHLLDAAACLWTARRIAARAVVRIPEDAEWDGEGLRMEIIR
jgi:predicted RNase H-like nuclease